MIDPMLSDVPDDESAAMAVLVDPETGEMMEIDPETARRLAEEELEARNLQLQALQGELCKKRKEAIDGRKQSGIEDIWYEDEEAYEGIDDANRHEAKATSYRSKSDYEGGRESRKRAGSTVFLNITRPYVDAAAARVGDMLLPTDDRNWQIKHTPIPLLRELEPMAAAGNLPAQQAHQAIAAMEAQAKKAAEAAEKRIEDWLVQSQYHLEARKAIEDCARIGTGILKGPFPVVDGEGTESPATRCIDPWNFYPDPACGENIQHGGFVFERDLLTARQLRKLADQPGYLGDQIAKVLKEGPGKKYVEDEDARPVKDSDLFEVWYYYGELSADEMAACDCPCDDGLDAVMAQVTLVNDCVIRAAEDPLPDGGFPFDVLPWQRRKDFWAGIGVARQIRSPQRMLNGAVRNMMDNAALAAGPQFLSRLGLVTPADGNWDIIPRKHWFVNEDADVRELSAAFTTVTFPMLQRELLEIVQFAIRIAEDVTGLPQLMQGSQSTKTPETLGGMQMMNNNANTVLRRIARLFDDFITEPHIRRYYEWIKAYGRPEEQGDFSIDARGSSALVERDIQSKAIFEMGKMVLQPAFGVDPKKWMMEWLKSQRLDHHKFDLDEEQLKKMAEAPKPPPPEIIQMEIAKLKAQTEMQREQLRQQADMAEIQAKIQEADRQRQFDAAMKERDMQMRAMEFAEKKNMTLEQIKADLSKFALDSRLKQQLQINEMTVKNAHGSGL